MLSAFCFQLFGVSVFAATYYVDFASGSDANNGTSTNTPWQHCPGDWAATGNAKILLKAGDTVNFKSGVVYYDPALTNNANYKGCASTILCASSGTSNAPITFQGLAGWGNGAAAISGYNSTIGWTNNRAFNLQGSYITVNNLSISNYFGSGIFAYYGGGNLTIENCRIGHIGYFPIDASHCDSGYAYSLGTNPNLLVVSNFFSDCGASTCSTGSSNYIFAFNEVTRMHGHGMQPNGAGGWLLIDHNYFHDNNDFGPPCYPHCDAIQIFSGAIVPTVSNYNNVVIVCNNRFYNNGDDVRFQYDSGYGGSTMYFFNNVEICTVPSGVGSGFGNSISNNATYVFNNTFYNFGLSAMAWAKTGVVTNVYEMNNLFSFSGNSIQMPSQNAAMRGVYDDYNLYNNAPGVGYLIDPAGTANNVQLAVFQAAWPNHEVHSVTSPPVIFVNLAAQNLALAAGSGGIGQGTNMSSLLPPSTFNFVPSAFRPDPTKDINGNQRDSSWDIGAFQYWTNATVQSTTALAPPNGLKARGN